MEILRRFPRGEGAGMGGFSMTNRQSPYSSRLHVMDLDQSLLRAILCFY